MLLLLSDSYIVNFVQKDLKSFRLKMLKKLLFIGILFAGFIYIISPVDLLPEALFGIFGYIDDLVVGLTMLLVVFRGIL